MVSSSLIGVLPRLLVFCLAVLRVHAADTVNVDKFGNVVSGSWGADSSKHWGPYLIDPLANQPKCLKPPGGCPTGWQAACTASNCPCVETVKYANTTKGAGFIGVSGRRDWVSADIVGELFNIVATEMVGQPMVYRDLAGRSSSNVWTDLDSPADAAGYAPVSTPCADCAALDCSLPGAAVGCDSKYYDIDGNTCGVTNSIPVDAGGYQKCDVSSNNERDVCAMVGAPMVSGASGCSMGRTPVWKYVADGPCTESATQSCGTEECCKTKHEWCKASFSLCRDSKIDLDVESWRMDPNEDLYKEKILIEQRIDHVGPIGFQGRETLYYAPEPWAETQRPHGIYPEFYKAYQQATLTNQFSPVGSADSNPVVGGDGNNCADMQKKIVLGGVNTAPGYGATVYRCNDQGRFIPPQCQLTTPTSKASDSFKTTCREVYGAKTSWRSGWYENFILGYDLPFVFKWLGGDWHSRLHALQNATTVANPAQLFYGYTPHPGMTKLKAQPVTMKPFEAGCSDGMSTVQAGKEPCEPAALSLGKVASKRFKEQAKEAYATLQRMTVSETDIQTLLSLSTAGGGPHSGAWNPACEWIKRNIGKVEDWVVDFGNCDAGSYFDRTLGQCKLAPAGSYTDRKGMDVPILCPQGYYSSEAGAISCAPCGKGTFMTSDRKSCTPCATGSFTDALASTACESCPRGTFAAKNGTSECSRCPFGSYSSSTGSVQCTECHLPDQTTVYSAATDVIDCVCREGTFLSMQTNTCQNCPEGLQCPPGSNPAENFGSTSLSIEDQNNLPQMHVKMGFYIEEVKEPFHVFACDASSLLDPEYSGCAGGNIKSCRYGRTGLSCGRCEDGFFNSGLDGTCEKCQAGDEIYFVGFFVFLAFVVVIPYYLINGRLAGELSTASVVAISFGGFITIIQMSGTLARVTVAWPKTLQEFWGVLAIVAFDLRSLRMECVLGDGNAFLRYTIVAISPLLAMAWLCAFGWFTRQIFRKPDSSGNYHWFRMENRYIANTIGTLYQAAFISVFFIVLEPLRCFEHPNGERSLVRYPHVLCGGSEHASMLVVFVLAFLILVIGFLGFYCYQLWILSKRNDGTKDGIDEKTLDMIKFIRYRFRDATFQYGLVILVRNILVGLAAVILGEHPFIQMVFLQATLLVYVTVTVYVWPWRSFGLNVLDAIQMLCVLLMITGSTPFLSPDVDLGMAEEAVGMVLFFYCFACFATCSFVAFQVGIFASAKPKVTVAEQPEFEKMESASGEPELKDKEHDNAHTGHSEKSVAV